MGKDEGQFSAISRRESGLRRALSSAQLTMIAIGGAIGTGLFLGSGFAIGFAGPGVLLSYALGALAALLVMGCLAEMTVVHPTPGSFGAWAEFYLGPWSGFLVRYSYWAAVVLAAGTEVTAVAFYMRFWFPQLPGVVWIALFAASLLVANGLRVEVFGAVEYLFSAIKIAAIALFIALGGWLILRSPPGSGIGLRNYTARGGFLPHGLWGVWSAVLVALFSYFSVEMIAVAAGEAHDPQRAITRAFRATFARLAGFYLLTLAVILAVVPWDRRTGAQSPFLIVMARTGIPHAAAAVNAILLIAALSAINSQLYITARILFSLARAGDAPRSIGRLSHGGIPLRALLLSTTGIGLGALLYAVFGDAAFLLMVSVSSFGAIFVWLMIFVTHLAFRRVHGETPRAFRMPGYPSTSLAGAGLMAALLLTTPFVPAFRMTLVFGIPFLLLLTAAYGLRDRSRSRASRAASARVE